MTKRVLVVEDEQPIRDLMADMLREAGYDVESAVNGEGAMSRMYRHLPDVILLDLMMPGMDGWAFIRTLRNQTKWGRVPIVVVSATHDLPAVAARLGVRASLTKPFDVEQLIAAVDRVAPLEAA